MKLKTPSGDLIDLVPGVYELLEESQPEPEPEPEVPPIPGEPREDIPLTFDGGSGPTPVFWSEHLQLRWQNRMGDWTDRDGIEQGARPWSAVTVGSAGWQEVDVTDFVLADRHDSFGLLMLSNQNTGIPRIAGRLSINAPVLVINGIEHAPVATAGWSASTERSLNTQMSFQIARNERAILQFDLSGLDVIERATLRFHVNSKSSGSNRIELYRARPPNFEQGGEVERGLAAHPDFPSVPGVYRAGDFSDMRIFSSHNSDFEQVADPANGGIALRGTFLPRTGTKDTRPSFNGKIELMPPDLSDPLRPPAEVIEELYCRLYVLLEDDWLSTIDGNKGAIGWDLRMGWWNEQGYWQSTTGNGGAPGTGLKLFAPAGKNGGSQRQDRWEYQGHSIRMEFGKGQGDGNPYDHLRPLQSYVYHLDQSGGFGSMMRLGNACVERGRWFCIEQRLKLNSITGPFDALGNGQAVADGVLQTWLDGRLVHTRNNLRFRRHPEMGIQGPWINWYYGGKQATERQMHYQINHIAVASEYIGPIDG